MHALYAPHARLQPLLPHAVRWKSGFWAEWFATCRETMIPNMWRLLDDPEISHAYANFRIAAGLEEGAHRGPKWHDGDLYKWVEAACHVLGVTGDAELDRLLDGVVEVIGRAQRADGYIHTPVIVAARNQAGSGQAFQERLHFETYNMGHLMTAACAHHQATGKASLLEIAARATDYLYRFYKTAAPELARNAICPAHYMGAIDMYRETGEPRYLELACSLVEIRDLVVDGGDDNQDRIPFREQTVAAGHAVRANYLYAGVADVYAETGDPSLLRTLERLWADVTSHKMYVTGGCGALYDGASPDGAVDQGQITRVHQAYGRAYQLPNATAHSETCANVGNVLWNWRMLAALGEARFADVMELALYNSVLSGISLDGKRFFYTNPLSRVSDLPFELRWSRQREPYISCFCCPPNVVRTIAGAHRYAYSTSEAGVWAHLYGSSVAEFALPNGMPVRLVQETGYPWDGEVRIAVSGPRSAAFGLMLRIPGWADRGEIAINGEPAVVDWAPGTYARLQRTWSPGDVVTLSLDMEAQALEAHPLVEELRSQVAIRRGPVIYCLESLDLPPGVGIEDVYLDPEVALEPGVDPALEGMLPGIVVLKGKAYAATASRDWRGQLYRPARARALSEIDVQLVPYFAWDNRGPGEMRVWLPALCHESR